MTIAILFLEIYCLSNNGLEFGMRVAGADACATKK